MKKASEAALQYAENQDLKFYPEYHSNLWRHWLQSNRYDFFFMSEYILIYVHTSVQCRNCLLDFQCLNIRRNFEIQQNNIQFSVGTDY